MSYSWGPDPDPSARPKAQLRDRIDMPHPSVWIGRAVWWMVTTVSVAFAGLAFAAGNREETIMWGTLAAVGFVAQDLLKLSQRVDRIVNPRRVDLPVRRSNPQPTIVRQVSGQHATPRRSQETPMSPTPDARSPMPQ